MSSQFTWTAADGTQVNLSDTAAGYDTLADGTVGLNSPGYRYTTQQYAGVDGVSVQAVSASQDDLALGMMVQADSDDDFSARVAALTRAMRPKAGPGVLTAVNDTGSARSIGCYYKAGLEGTEAVAAKLPGRWWKLILEFLPEDPWWLGETQTVNAGLGAGSAFFPILPMLLAPSSVQGQFTIDLSDSDDGAWPVWTIQGPGTGLVLANNTSGLSLSLDITLGVGESMTVDTRPSMKSARAGDGTNLMPNLTPGTDPNLWPLLPAVNDISCTLTGATSTSRIIGSYQPRYAGAG